MILVSASVFLLLNIAQSFQLQKGILSSNNMSAASYAYTFMKFDDSYVNSIGAANDLNPYGKQVNASFHQCSVGALEIEFNQDIPFGGEVIIEKPQSAEQKNYLIEVELDKYRMKDEIFEDVVFIVDGRDETGKTILYQKSPLYEIRNEGLKEWKHLFLRFEIPNRGIHDYKCYIYNLGGKSFKIKELQYRLLTFDPNL